MCNPPRYLQRWHTVVLANYHGGKIYCHPTTTAARTRVHPPALTRTGIHSHASGLAYTHTRVPNVRHCIQHRAPHTQHAMVFTGIVEEMGEVCCGQLMNDRNTACVVPCPASCPWRKDPHAHAPRSAPSQTCNIKIHRRPPLPRLWRWCTKTMCSSGMAPLATAGC